MRLIKFNFLSKIVMCTLLVSFCFLGATSINAAEATTNSDVYTNIMNSYESAKNAKDEINKHADALNKVIGAFPATEITVENASNIKAAIATWKVQFENEKAAFEDAYSLNWPIIEKYQEDLNAYNLSGLAPEGNITDGFYSEEFNAIEFLDEVDSIFTENMNSALSYEEIYVAYSDYEEAFKKYTAGWQANNAGDVDNDFENVWKPVVNSVYTLDFTSLGYTDEELKLMYDIDEYNIFLNTYKEKGKEAVDNATIYADYIAGVASEWDAAKITFESKLNDFNNETGNNVQFEKEVDYLTLTAQAMVTGLRGAYEYNLSSIYTYVKEADMSAYDWLHSPLSSNSIIFRGGVSGQDIIEVVDLPEYTPIAFSGVIPMIEVYEPLVVENVTPPMPIDPPVSNSDTSVNTGDLTNQNFYLILLGLSLIALTGSYFYKKKSV